MVYLSLQLLCLKCCAFPLPACAVDEVEQARGDEGEKVDQIAEHRENSTGEPPPAYDLPPICRWVPERPSPDVTITVPEVKFCGGDAHVSVPAGVGAYTV